MLSGATPTHVAMFTKSRLCLRTFSRLREAAKSSNSGRKEVRGGSDTAP